MTIPKSTTVADLGVVEVGRDRDGVTSGSVGRHDGTGAMKKVVCVGSAAIGSSACLCCNDDCRNQLQLDHTFDHTFGALAFGYFLVPFGLPWRNDTRAE